MKAGTKIWYRTISATSAPGEWVEGTVEKVRGRSIKLVGVDYFFTDQSGRIEDSLTSWLRLNKKTGSFDMIASKRKF